VSFQAFLWPQHTTLFLLSALLHSLGRTPKISAGGSRGVWPENVWTRIVFVENLLKMWPKVSGRSANLPRRFSGGSPGSPFHLQGDSRVDRLHSDPTRQCYIRLSHFALKSILSLRYIYPKLRCNGNLDHFTVVYLKLQQTLLATLDPGNPHCLCRTSGWPPYAVAKLRGTCTT